MLRSEGKSQSIIRKLLPLDNRLNNRKFNRKFQYCMISYTKRSRLFLYEIEGGQWLSGRVLDSRPRGRGFEPQERHCVVVLEQDTFILA